MTLKIAVERQKRSHRGRREPQRATENTGVYHSKVAVFPSEMDSPLGEDIFGMTKGR